MKNKIFNPNSFTYKLESKYFIGIKLDIAFSIRVGKIQPLYITFGKSGRIKYDEYNDTEIMNNSFLNRWYGGTWIPTVKVFEPKSITKFSAIWLIFLFDIDKY